MKSISTIKILKLNKKQNGKCFYCGDLLIGLKQIHIDHRLPKIKGGGNEIDNLCLTCTYCNLKKKDNSEEFMKNRIVPYVEGVIKDKKDLYDYHKFCELKQKFNL